MNSRLTQLQKRLPTLNLQALVVSRASHIAYLTHNFPHAHQHREIMLYLTPEKALLLHSPLIKVTTSKQVSALPHRSVRDTETRLLGLIGNDSQTQIGYDAQDLTVAELNKLQKLFDKASLVVVESGLDIKRQQKDAQEVTHIQKACEITTQTMHWATAKLGVQLIEPKLQLNKARVLTEILNQDKQVIQGDDWLDDYFKTIIKKGKLTEKALASLIELKLQAAGADDLSFPIHVAFDSNTALPHHTPTKTALQPDSHIMIDMGAKVAGYCADMTRTFSLSPTPPTDFLKIKSVVDQAYAQACVTLNNQDVKASSIDAAARNIITQAGYGDYFPHSTGHGLGLDIHESPSLSPQNDQELKSGMMVTIEPGIYLEGQFGYRFENTLLLT